MYLLKRNSTFRAASRALGGQKRALPLNVLRDPALKVAQTPWTLQWRTSPALSSSLQHEATLLGDSQRFFHSAASQLNSTNSSKRSLARSPLLSLGHSGHSSTLLFPNPSFRTLLHPRFFMGEPNTFSKLYKFFVEIPAYRLKKMWRGLFHPLSPEEEIEDITKQLPYNQGRFNKNDAQKYTRWDRWRHQWEGFDYNERLRNPRVSLSRFYDALFDWWIFIIPLFVMFITYRFYRFWVPPPLKTHTLFDSRKELPIEEMPPELKVIAEEHKQHQEEVFRQSVENRKQGLPPVPVKDPHYKKRFQMREVQRAKRTLFLLTVYDEFIKMLDTNPEVQEYLGEVSINEGIIRFSHTRFGGLMMIPMFGTKGRAIANLAMNRKDVFLWEALDITIDCTSGHRIVLEVPEHVRLVDYRQIERKMMQENKKATRDMKRQQKAATLSNIHGGAEQV